MLVLVLTAKHCVRGDVNGNCDGSIFVGNRRPNQGQFIDKKPHRLGLGLVAL